MVVFTFRGAFFRLNNLFNSFLHGNMDENRTLSQRLLGVIGVSLPSVFQLTNIFICLLTFFQELLVATRHVLATDFRRGFFPQIDTLLDERYVLLLNT